MSANKVPPEPFADNPGAVYRTFYICTCDVIESYKEYVRAENKNSVESRNMLQLKTSIAKQLGRSGEGGLAAADQDVLLQMVSEDDAFDVWKDFHLDCKSSLFHFHQN